MSEQEDSENTQADPFSGMMQFYDQWTKTWANSLSETVANPRFAETMAEQRYREVEHQRHEPDMHDDVWDILCALGVEAADRN